MKRNELDTLRFDFIAKNANSYDYVIVHCTIKDSF